MKIIIYILCIPVKLLATLFIIPLMAFDVALSFSLDGDNDVRIAKEIILDIWR